MGNISLSFLLYSFEKKAKEQIKYETQTAENKDFYHSDIFRSAWEFLALEETNKSVN